MFYYANFCGEHCELLEEYHDNIIAACLDASSCIPMSRQNRSNCIPGWNEFVKVYKDKALFWHKLWKEGGSPTSGVLFDLRRKTRYEYHRALRFVKRNAKNIRATRMAADLANNNKKNFWAELKRIIGRSSSLPSTVDDIVGADDIAELFHTKYDSLYNSVSYDTQEMAALTNEIESSIRCQSLTWNRINVDDIRHAINLIKAGKHDGLTGHCSDHIKNGTHMLHTHMSLLFNVMISHGFAPGGFRLATLIPIPKNKRKSLNKSSNYRAVALSSILGKVLDHIFLIKYSDILFSSELQYGFKKKHSTTQCTFVVNEIIQYYMNNGSNVNAILLDASRAFDRVNYVKLFVLLKKRKLCPMITRFLIKMYTSQSIRVKWGTSISAMCSVSNGVKQGGVLSPILFTIYFDEMLHVLKLSQLGCHIGHTFCGAIGYADDVILLAPSFCGLNKMLDICKKFADSYDVLFNSSKSKLLTFQCSNSIMDVKPIVFMDQPI